MHYKSRFWKAAAAAGGAAWLFMSPLDSYAASRKELGIPAGESADEIVDAIYPSKSDRQVLMRTYARKQKGLSKAFMVEAYPYLDNGGKKMLSPNPGFIIVYENGKKREYRSPGLNEDWEEELPARGKSLLRP